MKIGFIGLGNVGGKLAGSLLRNGFELVVRELDKSIAQPFLDSGARWAETPEELASIVDMVITCLPSPQACRTVMEGPEGVLSGLKMGSLWAEMSTTDEMEVLHLGKRVRDKGAEPLDCPVSGGCHRAATGNISIFVGAERSTPSNENYGATHTAYRPPWHCFSIESAYQIFGNCESSHFMRSAYHGQESWTGFEHHL